MLRYATIIMLVKKVLDNSKNCGKLFHIDTK